MTGLKVASLVEMLEALSEAAPGTKSQNPRSSFTKAADFLRTYADLSYLDFLDSLRASKPAVRKTPTKSKSPPAALDLSLIESSVSLLRNAELRSVEEFEAALLKIGKIRLAELKKVCEQYTGDTTKVSKKADAIGRMRMSFDYRWKLAGR